MYDGIRLIQAGRGPVEASVDVVSQLGPIASQVFGIVQLQWRKQISDVKVSDFKG